MKGTAQQVQQELSASQAKQVLAVTCDALPPEVFDALAERLPEMLSFLQAALEQGEERVAAKQLAQLLPPTEHSVSLMKWATLHARQAVMQATAYQAVLESAVWLTAEEIGQRAGWSPDAAAAKVQRWQDQRIIFSIFHQGTDYFPAYGLDPATGYQPVPALAQVIAIFQTYRSGRDMAFWFAGANGFLEGEQPQNLLASSPARVLVAAKYESEEGLHG